jgi:23S rRNA pseudouridine1911/1915/1917 synthase
LPPDPPSDLEPVEHPLDLLFEDEHLLVINKPALVPVHPGPGHHNDSLGNYLTWHYQIQGENHLYRPVNRLDRSTSGLMCVAKHAYAQERLKQQLHTQQFRRLYLAVCDGVITPEYGCIRAPIGRMAGSVLKRQVCADSAQAVTHYRRLRTDRVRSLVLLELETGRTHQIRVHLSHLGFPVTGDFLYGTEQPHLINHTALHSCYLSFRHPVTGQHLAYYAPLPEDLRTLFPAPLLKKDVLYNTTNSCYN